VISELISRDEALAFLTARQSSRKTREAWTSKNGAEPGWNVPIRRTTARHSRGGGPGVDYANYGARNAYGRLVMVCRLAPAPYGGAPVKKVFGELAPHAVYLSRLCGVGVSSDDLVEFLKRSLYRFPEDTGRRNPQRRKQGKLPYDCGTGVPTLLPEPRLAHRAVD
jgi:hypothetical protein